MPPTLAAARADSLTVAESIYTAARTLKDRLDIALLRGLADTAEALRGTYRAARRALELALAIDSLSLADSVDRRALRVMRRTFAVDLADIPERSGPEPPDSLRCDYDPRSIDDADSLEARLYMPATARRRSASRWTGSVSAGSPCSDCWVPPAML
ncbi:MAG: hypothetical protein ACREMW_01870 [Gemmatimonadales bacterium]